MNSPTKDSVPVGVRSQSTAVQNGDQLLPLLYRIEQRSGWSVGMRRITRALLADYTLPPGLLADIGCGGGGALAELAALHPDRTLCGVDLHTQALSHAQAHVTPNVSFAQADLHALPFCDNSVALLLALDAYDQRGVDLSCALRECRRVLCPDGLLLVRVSAFAWLTGPHDDAFNTGHRYEAAELLQWLEEVGYSLERVTFANTLLSLPEGALRLFQRWRMLPFFPSLYTTRAVDVLLEVALAGEARWLEQHDLPGGMSLYAVARKTCGGRAAQGSRIQGRYQ